MSAKSLIPTTFLLLMLAVTARAQSYSVNWYKIAGGGATSSGGLYSVSGTVGQADAGAMSGAAYSLTGGFWSLYAVQTIGAPVLYIAHLGSNVILSWSAA